MECSPFENYRFQMVVAVMIECCESGEDPLANAGWDLRDWGQYLPKMVLTPISKAEDCIFQCVRAGLTAFTLLSIQLGVIQKPRGQNFALFWLPT